MAAAEGQGRRGADGSEPVAVLQPGTPAPLLPSGSRGVVIGVGTDLVAVDRFAASVQRWGERLLGRVFTEAERRECLGHRPPLEQAAPRLAARFAAKEAAFKALGTGWGQGVKWQDVEVVGGGPLGPTLRLTGRAAEVAREQRVRRAMVSLTHDRGYALAFVVTTDD